MRVLEIHEAARVEGAVAGIVEQGRELARRDPLLPRRVGGLDGQVVERELAEESPGSVDVRIDRDPVVGRGCVVFLVEEVLPAAPVGRSGEHHLGARLGLGAVGEAPRRGVVARRPRGRLEAVQAGAAARDDVDDREEGARAVDRRAGAADHLHPLDVVDVEEAVGADQDALVDVVVEAVAVDQEERPHDVVARTLEATHPDEGVIAVVRGVEAAHAPQDLAQGRVAVQADLLRRDDAHRGGGGGHLLLVLRGAVDQVDLRQLLEAQPRQVGGRRGRVARAGPGRGGRRRSGREARQEERAGGACPVPCFATACRSCLRHVSCSLLPRGPRALWPPAPRG